MHIHTHTRTESAICMLPSEGVGRANAQLLTVIDYVAGVGGGQHNYKHYLLHYVF